THLLDNSPRVMNFGMDRQPTTWMLPPLPGGAVSPVIADLDGDGAGDLAMALPFENKIAVLQGVGDGTFREPKYYWIGQKPYWLGAGTRSGRPVLLGASAEGAGLQGVVMDFHGPLWTAPQGKATEKPRK
ncbi:MAG: VCBS repeat-containing protein, partial [Acidobacteria bacterium]|nr:VCBS repeat-containing protein [Acidobacteriota bacterium]